LSTTRYLAALDRRRHHRRRPDPAKPMSSSVAPPELHRRPESANNNPLKGNGAADLTIVRPAASAPPRRPELVGRHRPPNLSRARDHSEYGQR